MESGDFPVPVLFLKFGKNTGVVAKDSSPEGNDGTLHGPTWVTGFKGPGLSFDGIDNILEVLDDTSLRFGTGDFSIIMYFKSVTAPTDLYPVMIGKGDSEAGEWMLRLRDDDTLGFYANGTSWFRTDETYADNKWHQAAIVRDGSAAYLYVDGELKKTNIFVGSVDLNTVKVIQVGCADSSSFRYWEGVLDEVRIYDVALTARRVLELYYGIE